MIPDKYSRQYLKIFGQKAKGVEARKNQEESIHLDLNRKESSTMAFLQMTRKPRDRSRNKISGGGTSSLKHPPEVDCADETHPHYINQTSPFTSSISTKLSLGSGDSSSAKKQKTFTQGFINLPGGKTAPQAKENCDVAIAHYIIAKQHPLYEAEDFLFNRVITAAQHVNSSYKPPGRNEIGGPLLDAVYLSYHQNELCNLLKDALTFGLAIYGDGAFIKTVPQINILAASPSSPGCVLNVIDCTNHMSDGGKKDAAYISKSPPKFHDRKDDRDKELAELIHTFWEELDDFQNEAQYFNKPHIWHTAADEKTVSHVWHKHYSLPYTKVFGRIACYTTSQIAGPGEAERNWKTIKGNKSGKCSRLSP